MLAQAALLEGVIMNIADIIVLGLVVVAFVIAIRVLISFFK